MVQIKKILYTSDLAKKRGLNSNFTEIESKIASITGLATNSALSAVENKIPDASGLIKKKIIIQQLVTSKRKLVIIIMTNTLLLQNLII